MMVLSQFLVVHFTSVLTKTSYTLTLCDKKYALNLSFRNVTVVYALSSPNIMCQITGGKYGNGVCVLIVINISKW